MVKVSLFSTLSIQVRLIVNDRDKWLICMCALLPTTCISLTAVLCGGGSTPLSQMGQLRLSEVR